jgi:hypothetical protein
MLVLFLFMNEWIFVAYIFVAFLGLVIPFSYFSNFHCKCSVVSMDPPPIQPPNLPGFVGSDVASQHLSGEL